MVPQYADFIVVNGKMWYSSCLINGLFTQSIESGEVEFVGCFPNEDFFQENLYRRIILVDEELIFIPFCAKHISVYHLGHKSFTSFDIPDAEIIGKYVSAILVEKKIYLFPAYAEKAIVFDVEKKKILELKQFNEVITNWSDSKVQKFYLAGTARLKDYIYLIFKDTNQLIRYSYKENKISRITVDCNGGSLGGIDVSQDNIYISVSGKKQIICLNSYGEEKTDIFYQTLTIKQQNEMADFPILKYYNQKIYLHFMGDNILQRLDLVSMNMENILLTEKKQSVYLMKQEDKELFFLPCQGCPMYRYNIEDNKVYKIPEILPKTWNAIMGKGIKVFLEEKNSIVIYENEKQSLKQYLEMMPGFEKCIWENKKNDTLGEIIWKNIKVYSHIAF